LIWKAAFSVLGLGSLLWILNGYGFGRLVHDASSLGWWSLPLALSFLPVVFCYGLAWWLLTPALKLRHLSAVVRFSVIAVAWNNLSPFVKVLGEPIRVVLLERWLPRKPALQSVVLYNLVHVLGTLGAFFFGSLALLLFFPVSKGLRVGFLALLVLSPLILLALYFGPHYARLPRARRRAQKGPRSKFMKAGFWLRWSLSKIRIFSGRHPLRFWAAVTVEIAARFVEGLTFYFAFLAMGHAAPAFTCALLDVGRALMDNIFFFIPYQMGSREGGILLLAQHAVGLQRNDAVSAAVFYRLVEILWMGAGYIFWISDGKSLRSSR
jgi:Lysylphosphatidylglycerol synthase TM region